MIEPAPNLRRAISRMVSRMADHLQYRDEFSKAYRTVARFPCLTIRGGANHHLLNGDIFENGHVTSIEDAVAARELQALQQNQEDQETWERAVAEEEKRMATL